MAASSTTSRAGPRSASMSTTSWRGGSSTSPVPARSAARPRSRTTSTDGGCPTVSDFDLTPHPETLRQYALLADGHRGALVGPRGDVAFLCAPRWHDDAVFSDLLGGRGTYVVRPTSERFVWGGNYEPGTLIWRSRWVVGPDLVQSREALACPGARDRVVLLRRIEATRGGVEIGVSRDCRAGFGSEARRLRAHEGGVWSGRTGGLHVRWTGAPRRVGRVEGGGGVVAGSLTLDEGAHHDMVLEISPHPLDDELPDADRLWHLTEDAWA